MYRDSFSALSYIIPSFSCFFEKHGMKLRLKRIFFQIANLVRKPYSLHTVIQYHFRAIFMQRIGSIGERLIFCHIKHQTLSAFPFRGRPMSVELFHYSFIKEASGKYYHFISTEGYNLYALTYWLTLLKTFDIYCAYVLDHMLTNRLA